MKVQSHQKSVHLVNILKNTMSLVAYVSKIFANVVTEVIKWLKKMEFTNVMFVEM